MKTPVLLGALLLALAPGAAAMELLQGPPTLQVSFVGTTGERVGTATLTEVPQGVRVELDVRGLTPGVHAIHLHAVGACALPDFTSAGGHFNPHGRQHGSENPQGRHAGDLPNFTVSPDGTARVELLAEGVTLRGGKAESLLDDDGSALVIHAKADDYRSDPAGNAGGRIACAVIRR